MKQTFHWTIFPTGASGGLLSPAPNGDRIKMTAFRRINPKSIIKLTLFTLITLFPLRMLGAFSGGDGSLATPYLVATAADLNNVRNYLGSGIYFKQTADIDLSGYSDWQAIADDGTNYFMGNYDGNGKRILNLTQVIGPTEQYGGVFGASDLGYIKNLGVVNVNISGGNNTGIFVGGLVGATTGTIQNCFATGTINVNGSTSQVGGFIGDCYGTISDSYSQCTVTYTVNLHSPNYNVGGFVGWNEFGASILNCYSTGAVSITELVGNYGGFCGWIDGTISGCYYDQTTSGQSDNTKGTPKTTAQMQTSTPFTGWSTSTWSFVAGNYPSLKSLYINPTVTTQAVSSIGVTTATGNGNITDLGYPNPTAYGVCWGTSANPTTSNSKTDKGAAASTGAFTANITSLTANTTYHVRAFATNAKSTVYGSDVSFTTLTAGTFTGATNNDWATAGNWAGGSVPTSSTDVTIPSGKTAIISATTSADCNNLSVSGTLTIQSSASGTGSLIVSGTPTGNVSCQRYLTGNAWHVVSPTAAGGGISAFIQAAGNSIATSGSNYGMMDYNESGNNWNGYFTTGTGGSLASGKGYCLRRSADGVVTFTGTLATGDKTVPLTKSDTLGWNCVGNPFTSAIGMNSSAVSASNFLGVNAASLDTSYACVYVWDGASSYKILGNVSYSGRDLGQNLLQPGQGFFVKAASSGSITFNSNMQAHQTGGGFKSSGISWPGFELKATAGAATASTLVAFNSAMTRGLDPTYDAGLLRGGAGLELYTRLVNDNGVDFAIQCLPEKYDNLVIPVGLESKNGGEISFSAETIGLPGEVKVVIEDKLTGSFTPLQTGAAYKVTMAAGAKGTGRFYLHVGNGVADIPPLQEGAFKLKAYPAHGEIIVEGEVGNHAQAILFDVTGRKLGQFLLRQGNRNTLPAAGLTRGIYLLKVTDGSDRFSTKIVIR